MGIRNLYKYIKKIYAPVPKSKQFSYKIEQNIIYTPKNIYIDLTHVIINFSLRNHNPDLLEFLKFLQNQLQAFLGVLSYYNNNLFIFLDLHTFGNINLKNILFSDFILKPSDISREELLYSTALIKRNFPFNEKNVVCLYELQTRDSKLHSYNLHEYVSLSYLLKNCEKNRQTQCNNRNELIHSNSKNELIKSDNKNKLTQSNNKNESTNVFEKTNNRNESAKKINIKISRKDSSEMSNDKNELVHNELILEQLISYGWYRYIFKRGVKQFKKVRNKSTCAIPPGIIICYTPLLLERLNLPRTSIYKCAIESDFAIRNHVNIYTKNSFPKIITNDTDLVVLLCDVDCDIEISIFEPMSHSYERRHINPILFWQSMFGCVLNPDIIKTLCVLMGTDFNQYSSESPIHLRYFKEILKILNITKYEELTIDALKLYILKIAQAHRDSKFVKETVAALNLYLLNIEGDLNPIDKEDFLFHPN
jgi:hypothetical protein